MMEGREILEKNAYLEGLEELFKKYGYTRVGCDDEFKGTKDPGLLFYVHGKRNDVAGREITEYVNPVHGMEDFDGNDISAFIFRDYMRVSDADLIYEDGVFYRRE